MSRDNSQNHYGPNASFDGYDSDLASAGILIESLRQQLAAALAAIKVKDAFIEKIAKQTPEKPDYWSSCSQCGYNSSEAEDVLAATTDLDGLILCHAEPCRDDGRCQYAIDRGAEGMGHCPEGKCCMPRYRAWEPKQ